MNRVHTYYCQYTLAGKKGEKQTENTIFSSTYVVCMCRCLGKPCRLTSGLN